MNEAYNPHITLESPFPRTELPTLFCWQQKIHEAVIDDSIPKDLNEWMDFQMERIRRPEVVTWGIYKDGNPGGYFEVITHALEDTFLDESLTYIAEGRIIFKRELWGLQYTRTAINLGLRQVFDSGIETVFFPAFKDSHPLKTLFAVVGLRSIGAIRPKVQKGKEVATELYAISETEWKKKNAEFLAAVDEPEVAVVGG